MRTTQRDMVVNYIRDFGSITSWEAYTELGITQLGARIFELKERGYIFNKEKVKKLNRYGKQITFDRYKIVFEGGLNGYSKAELFQKDKV